MSRDCYKEMTSDEAMEFQEKMCQPISDDGKVYDLLEPMTFLGKKNGKYMYGVHYRELTIPK